ncbi:phasin family protein [Hassallia byssoidea VB512170]|uniref:Phasin family protein n=1 Tax=Hassallia byssoidea VB512170 TaxID=1304833 RepID=A0A846H9I3_9CYAN|nr:hypothetical protein [Hassalia byssoidea]NEU73618.1 phasin family protein [Hassalia byssoidea VB512170]
MKKQNKLVVWLKSLPVAVIFLLWLLNANKFIYAQISSPTAIPTLSLSNTASQNQTSSSVEPKQDSQLIAAIAAFGSLLSGIAAILALRKSQNNEKINDLLSKQIFKYFDSLIKQSKDPIEKKRLLDQKKFFEEELRALTKRSDASKKAGKWLKDRRERLAEEAVQHALSDKFITNKDIKEKLYSHLNDYLHGIQESLLEICDTDYIDELVNELASHHVLDSSDYKKALQFLINDKIPESNLSLDSQEELKNYFDYLIRSLP